MNSNELPRMFAAYWGCDININTGTDKPRISSCFGLKYDTVGADGTYYAFNQCKLSLFPLLHLSNDHAIQVAKLCGIDSPVIERGDMAITLRTPRRILKIYFSNSNSRLTDKGFEVIEYNQCIIDTLRGLGYDMGFLQYPSLIQAGFAVDASNPPAERSVATEAQ